MPSTIPLMFPELGDGLIKVLTNPDPEGRRAAVVAWREAVLPALQQALPDALDSYIQLVLQNNGAFRQEYDPQAWSSKAANNQYSLSLELKVRRFERKVAPATVGSQAAAGFDGDDYGSVSSGRTPNDNRSDTLNPNNPASHAAANNYANQMNPNNPAYGSSRSGGGGRGGGRR